MFEANLRRQARVCAQLDKDCGDPYLAERLKLMAAELPARAGEPDELGRLPGERLGGRGKPAQICRVARHQSLLTSCNAKSTAARMVENQRAAVLLGGKNHDIAPINSGEV